MGETINTPSMLCVEDVLDTLSWADSVGGLDALVSRNQENFSIISEWVAATGWTGFLAASPGFRSSTSVCLSFSEPWFGGLSKNEQAALPKKMATLLADEKVAYDIASYRDAPPGLRIWAGATVDCDDLSALMPWLDWAYAEVKSAMSMTN